jgi:hypothetical protein
VIAGGDYLELHYKPVTEEAGRNGNIVLALMTTAYGRMKLYDIIAKYSSEVVYFDTDSVFLHLPPGVEGPATSAKLGELKDEIQEGYGPGHHITSLDCLGPKTYTYTVENDEGQLVHTEVKAKGIQLSSDAMEVVTPEAMKNLLNHRHSRIHIPQFQISRDIAKKRLFNRDFNKILRYSSSKRWLAPGKNRQLATLPYGYVATQQGRAEQRLEELLQILNEDPDLQASP